MVHMTAYTNHDNVEILLWDILQGDLFNCHKISILQIQAFVHATIRSFPNLISKHLHQAHQTPNTTLKTHVIQIPQNNSQKTGTSIISTKKKKHYSHIYCRVSSTCENAQKTHAETSFRRSAL